jgi:putative membrane fusion protein
MKSKVGRNISIFFCLLLIAAIAALYVYIYAIPSITGSLTETAVLSYGRLSTSNEAKCLIIRTEKVIKAESGGETGYYIPEGEKTRKGVKVMDIYGSPRTSYFCEETGFISYYIDGYEDILTPETMENIVPVAYLGDEEREPAFKPEPTDRTAETVEKGDPVFKLITSDAWTVAAFIPSDYANDYEWGQTVTVVFPDGDEIPGTISSTVDRDDYLLALIQIKRYYPDFAKIRMLDVTIITRDSEGLIVPNSALAEEDGQKGVYVKDINGGYNFKRVKVIVTTENESLLVPDSFTEKNDKDEVVNVDTVRIYDEVLRNAEDK